MPLSQEVPYYSQKFLLPPLAVGLLIFLFYRTPDDDFVSGQKFMKFWEDVGDPSP